MKFFFLFAALLVLPFVSASELRSESANDLKETLTKIGGKIGKNQVGTMSLVGTFPSSPVYASTQLFTGGCGAPLTLAKTILTGVCFSNGLISETFTCSKHLQLICP
jgi:hypothetical protein